jgi:N utilization substance protein A
MKSDFLLAITQLAAEKNLSKEVVLGAVEAALASAYRKDSFSATQNIEAKIDPSSGRVKVWAEKTVTAEPVDKRWDISLEDARKINAEAELDDLIMVEDTPHNAGRIAAQTAKQVILQRLHEAEHGAIFEEYAGKEGDIVSATVERVEPKQVLVNLGRGEAIMPLMEQMPTERYRSGQRLKVFLVEVARTAKGPLLVVSRSHPSLLRRLFELEVPEVFNGIVEIKSVAREAGFRSKVAVVAHQTGIDPVGCCVGLRGIRIQNIVNELSGEKIDVVAWDEDPATFIASALSPAHVVRVELDEAEQSARVIIPDKQLSLAIGKVGQNVRLAVKLTGWRIDIKSASEAEAEAVATGATAEEAAEVPEPLLPGEEPPLETEEKAAAKEEEGEAIPLATFETPVAPEAATAGKAAVRFAEDLRPVAAPKVEVKTKKKKKKKILGKDSAQDGIKLKKKKRGATAEVDDDEEYI